MRLLLLTQNYPDIQYSCAQAYVHNRAIAYRTVGIKVDIISFNCKSHYVIDEINVYPPSKLGWLLSSVKYKAVICHAPNIRNHILLIIKNLNILPKIFFVFHGHEILIKSKYYPPPYDFKKGACYFFFKILDRLYDSIKTIILNIFIRKLIKNKLYIIFVSQYLKKLFFENLKLKEKELLGAHATVSNTLREEYFKYSYSWKKQKPYDFITIRPYDNSTYAIDLIVKIAEHNPDYSFHIFGEGSYFKYNQKPKNIKVFSHFRKPMQIVKLLNNYKAALMPSRHDSQGVMMCEMATFGIPMVISHIPAHLEMLEGYPNIYMIDNQNPQFCAKKFLSEVKKNKKTLELKTKFSLDNTFMKEVALIKSLTD